MLLRIAIGFHFFKEGTTKLNSGDFTAKPVLSSAKGPLAPLFKQMLEDPDGERLFGVRRTVDDNGHRSVVIDPELSIAIWDDFVDQATIHYGFGGEELQAAIARRREALAFAIRQARTDKNPAVDTADLESQRAAGEQIILQIREQPSQANAILDEHVMMIEDWIMANQAELTVHFNSADRLNQFERDGENGRQSAIHVDSLRGQVDSIRRDRQKELGSWTAEVTAIWDSLEEKINGLAVGVQAEKPSCRIHRPFDQSGSFIKIIDRVVPWFDTIVGALLIVGLFTRVASLLAVIFLVSIVLTQPPWIPGTIPTYFHIIESLALLVIFATCAGRMGGLDYFTSLRKSRFNRPEIEGQS